MKINSEGWTRRVRIGAAPEERELNPERTSALETSIKNYVERKSDIVVNPVVGTSFDCLEDAYDLYNLYSWEVGFGVRYAKCRLNVHRKKCVQEIVCGCAGKPLMENSRSARWDARRSLDCFGRMTKDGTYVGIETRTTVENLRGEIALAVT